jgi:hypothetical protein
MLFLRITLFVQFQYLRTLFVNHTKSDFGLASFCLKGNLNSAYRLSSIENNERLVGLKVLNRTWVRLFKKIDLLLNTNNNFAIIDDDATVIKQKRIDYIAYVLKKPIENYLCKEELVSYPLPFYYKAIIFLVSLINALWIVPLCIFSKKRIFYALYMYFIIESILSIYFCKKNRITTAIFSSIFSQDSNINFLFYKYFKIEVIKNPSEDPLAFDNSILLTDKLLICNPYQIEEIKQIKTIKTSEIIYALPEQTLDYSDKYSTKTIDSEKNTIGFYSSGSWLRKEFSMNYHHQGIDCAEQEDNLLLELNLFITKNPTYKIKIFLHPLEKKSENALSKVKSYYSSKLSSIPYEYNDLNEHTCLSFEKCDVAISLFSGSNLYRLMFGYKTLYYVPNNSFKKFPLDDTSLSKINIGKQRFDDFLYKNLAFSEDEFFKEHYLQKYLYQNQKNLLNIS